MIPDVTLDPNWIVVPGLDWVRSHVSAPISVKGKVIGAIGLNSQQKEFFSKNDVHQLLAFANAAAIAIDNARLYAEVQRLAITDELTGLYNYRALMELGPREIERARRFNRSVSALFLDIDHFRNFNTRYSHTVGNEVLSAVAHCMLDSVRSMDLVVRFGGEEFVILLPETGLPAAKLIAERLGTEIATTFVKTDDGDLSVTVSVGVAELLDTMPDLKTLIDCANQAEHLAKDRGRNRVEVF